MRPLRQITGFALFLWLAIAFLSPDPQAQTVSEATSLPEGMVPTGDVTEVRALTVWVEENRQRYPDQARQLAERALTLAEALDDLPGIGKSAVLLGNISFFFADLYQAEAYYTLARKAFEQIGDESGLLEVQSRVGIIHGRRGDMEQALGLLMSALEGFERLGMVGEQARVLTDIGSLHRLHGDRREDEMMYYEQALMILEDVDNVSLRLRILSLIGSSLAEASLFDESVEVLMQALNIAEESNTQYQLAYISNNIGFALNEQGHYERALSFLVNAEELGRKLGERLLLIAVHDELGKALMGLGQYDRALDYALEGLEMIQGVNGNMPYLMEIHQTLSHIYEAAGDPAQALSHHRLYAAARDSAFNIEKTEITAEMQARYDAEQKERTIERLEQQSQIQALRQTLLLVGMGSLLLLLGLFYYRYRTKQKANRLLEELDAAKSRFFANISHEFRTPLTVILGGIRDTMTGRFGRVSDEVVQQQRVMLRNTHQLQNLINEVLDLNRLESGQLPLRLTPGDLVQLLKHIVEANAPLAERNGVTLTLVSEVETCARLYDEEKLDKIVGNLLSNALKFTPRDGTVRVNLQCREMVEIHVEDDGPGIPAESQANIFERFAQLDQGLLKGGTGIGLALAKELVELHGGTITLRSTPGEGTTFVVRLPLQAVKSDGPIISRPRRENGHTIDIPQSGGLVAHHKESDHPDQTTVLIIEDNDDVRAYIRRSLEDSYRILTATNGEEGMQQARSELPDLIVSDVMLPDVDGYEIAKQLKASASTECIPIVMLTARAAESDHVTGYESGAEAYVTKPFSPETLRAVITRLLEERRRLRRQLQAEVQQSREVDVPGDPLGFSDHARAIVLENLHDEEFGIEELASALNVTRRTLHNYLKSEVALSPSEFIRTLRLEHARRLLSDGAGTVSEVAYAVGFKSLSHFTRRFREHFGEVPSSFLAVRE